MALCDCEFCLKEKNRKRTLSATTRQQQVRRLWPPDCCGFHVELITLTTWDSSSQAEEAQRKFSEPELLPQNELKSRGVNFARITKRRLGRWINS